MTSSPDEILISTDMFAEPENYYEPEPEPTFIDFHRNSKYVRKGEPATINLRLVGKSPLWGHLLWNAGKLTTDYIDENRDRYITGKTVLELGAAAALPSLVAALSAAKVVITDYPDPELIENIQYNVNNGGLSPENIRNVKVMGYIWGNDVSDILAPLNDYTSNGSTTTQTSLSSNNTVNSISHLNNNNNQNNTNGRLNGHSNDINNNHNNNNTHHTNSNNTSSINDGTNDIPNKFDFIILSDLIFNHSEHAKLVKSMDKVLKPEGKALVVFSPHRPKLYQKDLDFFTLAKSLANFDVVEKFERDYMPMFEEDDETKELRGKAFGYLLQRNYNNKQ